MRRAFMSGATTVRFELVSKSAGQIRTVFARVVELLMSASRELEHAPEAARTAIHRAASLLQAQMGYDPTQGQEPSPALLAWQIRRVQTYIEQHLDQRILVAGLSELVNLSEAHFSRAFRLVCDEPPHAYILRRRVNLAAQLMLGSREPLGGIALKCGFHDQAHLSKQFRQLTGETPAAWRRRRLRPANMDLEVGGQMIPSARRESWDVRPSGDKRSIASPTQGCTSDIRHG
jgi:AraC family transcriptional regulator